MDSLATRNPSQNATSGPSFRAELFSVLFALQNADGGWPFHSSGDSRVEPTCWAVLALADLDPPPTEKIGAGLRFLTSAQLKDGSWPASPGMCGGWVTSLACSVLANRVGQPAKSEPESARETQSAIQAGLQWLSDDYPQDSGGWQKFLKKFSSRKKLVAHSDEFRGWGWTPRTASWVEPTAFALMAFADTDTAASPALAKAIAERRALAIGLLYDRMCPRGGWNCGNPRVYGVDGDPLVLPTCWALLALRDEREHPNRALSLAWLRDAFGKIESAGSLAMAGITLDCYGVAPLETNRSLTEWSANDLTQRGTHVLAWAALALNANRGWPGTSQIRAAGAAK